MKNQSLLILLLFSISTLGQNLEVQVKDEHTDRPVEGAYVSFLGNRDSLFGTTDAKGNSAFPNKSGGNMLIHHLSYEDKSISVKASDIQLVVYLSPSQDELEEVVVTGQASPVLASKAVRQVKVIGRERIDRQAAVNLGDLLQNDLNFRITEDAILGSQINLQGLSGAQVKILIDGVPVIGRLDGNIDLNQINLSDIERVEIVEGPMAVQYGTDAVAGTINLITKRKAVSTVETKLNAYYETVGRYNFDGSLNFPIGKMQGNISLGRNFFDGYDPSETARNLQWNPKEQYFVAAGLQRRFEKILLRYRGKFFDEEIINRGEVGSIDSMIVPADTGAWKYPRTLDDYYHTLRINNSLYANYYINPRMKIKAFVAYNHYKRIKNTLVKNLNTGEENFFTGTDAQDTTIFGLLSSRMFFQHHWFPNKFSYQLGYDFSYEENLGRRIENDYQSIADAALFATTEYQPTEDLNNQPGLRLAYNSRFEAPLITSLALRYQFVRNWVLRASYGQGFRAPSLKELYFLFVDENHNILGNEDLKAENSDNLQLSLNYSKTFEKATLETGIRGFFNNIENEIRLVSVIDPDDENPRGLYRNENIAQTQTTGTTLDVTFTYSAFEASAGATFIGIRNELALSDAGADAGYSEFNFYPQYRLNLSYTFDKIGLTPALFMNYTGQRSDLILSGKGEFTNSVFDPYLLTDFTLQKKLWKDRLQVSAGVKNLLNVTNIQANNRIGEGAHSTGTSSIPLSYGRTFFARMQFNL